MEERNLNAFLLAVVAGLATTALLVTFYLPVTKIAGAGHMTWETSEFIRLWEYHGQKYYDLALLGEVVAGVFMAGAVYAGLGHNRRAPADLR